MSATYTIRAAKGNDLDGVLALEREIGLVPHWRLVDYVSALTPMGHERETDGLSRCFFLAEIDTSIVGFAVAHIVAAQAELESIGVAEPSRRLGVGGALCAKVIKWSREMCAGTIELEVRSRSEGAMSLYRSHGFVAVGKRPGYYQRPEDDAVLMRLDLASRGPGPDADRGDL